MKILMANDRALVGGGLQHILKELSEELTFFEAHSIEDAVSTAEMHPDLDLVLIGLASASGGGLGALAALRSRHRDLRIMLVSPYMVPDDAMSALANGAKGYITEMVLEKVFLQAVRLVMNGGVYIPKELLAAQCLTPPQDGAAKYGSGKSNSNFGGLSHEVLLTPRQTQVLELMSQGKSNKVIGRELSLAPGTVKAHVSCVLRALGVYNRTQAVVTARVATGNRNVMNHAPLAFHVN